MSKLSVLNEKREQARKEYARLVDECNREAERIEKLKKEHEFSVSEALSLFKQKISAFPFKEGDILETNYEGYDKIYILCVGYPNITIFVLKSSLRSGLDAGEITSSWHIGSRLWEKYKKIN